MTDPEFNKEEFAFLSNAGLLIQKRIIQDKVFALLELTKTKIAGIVAPIMEGQLPSAKISRGENYQSLPYLILDYPAIFSLEDIFACRTMFLWGNFFSTTIHLQGRHLDNNRNLLPEIVKKLEPGELFVSVGETPWQYHYRQNNYVPLEAKTLELARQNSFVKISKRIPLSAYQSLPTIAKSFYEPFLSGLVYRT